MSLQKYKQKRNFKDTPEPEGKEEKTQKFRFVIQKHVATRLHYDFRIEHEGVLKSWAVPKGVPNKSNERHLAMAVEDHPLDYFDFEGVIPENNYGAGTVMVWDVGTYSVPHAESKADIPKMLEEGFEKGELKLELHGKKLKGLVALVRFKKAGENAWLFIKDKDEHEGKKVDDVHSAKSGLTMDEITKKHASSWIDGKEVKKKSEKIKASKNISPMLATLHEEPFNNADWIFENKLDGYRVVAHLEKGDVNIFSRNQIIFNNKYKEIVEALGKYKFNAVFDGEVVVEDDKGKSSFQLLQDYPITKKGNIIYYIFDILFLDGLDLRQLPLIERKKALKKIIKDSKHIKLVEFTEEKGIKLFAQSSKSGSEGIIAKLKDSIYEDGVRTKNWLKIKNVLEDEFVIGGYTKPEGQRKGFGSLLLGTFKGDKLEYVGNTGTGFDEKKIKDLLSKFEKVETDKSPFAEYNGANNVKAFLKPKLIAQIKYAERTNDGMLRQAVYLGLREDKDIGGMKEDGVKNLNTSLTGLLTHSEKLWFPKKKYTKLDLAKYYIEVADFILPYLKDRPQNMNRFPDGINGKSFYHKDFEVNAPDFVETVDIFSESSNKEIKYIVCNNIETLIYLVNLGCIEINAWNSRVNDLESPDYLIFDIDPDTDFSKAIEVSLKLHDLLDSIKMPNYIKTSGKRGLHINVPLNAKYDFEQVRTFSEIISKVIEREMSDIVNLERNPDKRKGMVYIDFPQNRRGQTTASVYAARPVEDATVSMPLKWSEVDKKLDPKDFTIKNALKRLEKTGDLWKPVLGEGADLEKVLKALAKMLN